MHTTDVPLTPEDRLREVAAILASGQGLTGENKNG